MATVSQAARIAVLELELHRVRSENEQLKDVLLDISVLKEDKVKDAIIEALQKFD